MKRVLVKNSKQAVEAITGDIKGKKIRIKNVYEKQNVSLRKFRTFDIIVEGRRRFKPDCGYCLKKTGYSWISTLSAFTNIDKGAELTTPNKLDTCQTIINGSISTIELQSEDGTLISFALPEGCRGSLVEFDEGGAKPVDKKNNNHTVPLIYKDPKVLPSHMWAASKTYGFLSVMQLESTDSLWQTLGINELPVQNVRFEVEKVDIGVDCSIFKNELTFVYPRLPKKIRMGENRVRQFFVSIHLGEHHQAEEVLRWIDVTRPNEETVRYEVDTGFKYFLYEC